MTFLKEYATRRAPGPIVHILLHVFTLPCYADANLSTCIVSITLSSLAGHNALHSKRPRLLCRTRDWSDVFAQVARLPLRNVQLPFRSRLWKNSRALPLRSWVSTSYCSKRESGENPTQTRATGLIIQSIDLTRFVSGQWHIWFEKRFFPWAHKATLHEERVAKKVFRFTNDLPKTLRNCPLVAEAG